jgi:protein-S-isoprenylcysteine O-methyltransferase Ste14
MSDMDSSEAMRAVTFLAGSAGIVCISRRSLLAPRSHGFYRFFAWELILGLFLLNADVWFRDPFAPHQLVSWLLLVICVVPVVLGVHGLRGAGKPVDSREGDPSLLAFEKTTSLVKTGIYRYIRHPLYSSLLILAWGIFFKAPSWLGLALAAAATVFLFATALADEAECVRFFGPVYRDYMSRTKRFIPFVV